MSDDPGTKRPEQSGEGDGGIPPDGPQIGGGAQSNDGKRSYLYHSYQRSKEFLRNTKSDHWLAIGTWVLVILTWNLVRNDQDAFITANRAWISPSAMHLDRPLEYNSPVEVVVFAQDTGRAPATNVAYRFHEFLVKYIPDGSAPTSPTDRPNTACDGLTPTRGEGAVIYPGKTNAFIESDFPDTPGNRAIVIQARTRQKTMIIDGCIAYRTFNSDHISKFQFMLRDVPGPSCIIIGVENMNCAWHFNATGTGADAN